MFKSLKLLFAKCFCNKISNIVLRGLPLLDLFSNFKISPQMAVAMAALSFKEPFCNGSTSSGSGSGRNQ